MTPRPMVFLFVLACTAIVAPWISSLGVEYLLGSNNFTQCSIQQLLTWSIWLTLLLAALAIIPLQIFQLIRLRQFNRQLNAIDVETPSFSAAEINLNRTAKAVYPHFEKILGRLKRAISREKGLIAELNEARDYTDLLLESVGEAILVFDGQGKLQDFNAVSERLFGLSAYRHIGTAPVFLALGEDVFYQVLDKVTKEISRNGYYQGDLRLRSANGEFIYAEATVAPVGSFKSLGRNLYISAVRDVSARHKAIKALEESEHRYRLVTDGSPLGIYIYQEGKLVFANQRLAAMLDSNPDDLLKGNLWDFFDPADIQAIQTRMLKRTKALPAGTPSLEIKLKTVKGETKWVELQSGSFLLNGKPATIGNVKDITESRLARQEARNRLREIEVLGRISALANRAQDLETMLNKAVAAMNEIVGLQGGCVLLESRSEQALVLKCQDNAPNWLMEYARELAATYKQSKLPDRGIESFPASYVGGPQNTAACIVPLMSVDRPVGCLLMWGEKTPDHNTARFITSVSLELGATVERLRLVEALQTSERRYRDLFENAGDLIEAVDDQGRYVYVNKRWKEVLGYTESEVENLRVDDVVDPAWLDTYKKLIEEVKAKGEIENAELVYVCKDGGQVRVEGGITARVRNGQIAYTRSIVRDVTTNRMLQEHMQRAQRIESLAIMAGGMAHDFNNVLMAVLGNTSLLMSEVQADTNTYKRLANIEQQALSGCSVTKQLLNIARTKRPDHTQVDVVAMLQGIVEVVRRTHRGLTVELNTDKHLPEIKGDEGQLHQAFMNLLINAAQATEDGGWVQVKAASTSLNTEDAQARDLEMGEFFRIEVHDNGHGIEEGDLKRIFDPFFSTKDRNRGTGLGLTMTYRTIKQHNGFIGVESQKAKGTTFTVLLPACVADKKRKLKPCNPLQESPGNLEGKTIMVVDDEVGVRQTIVDMLLQTGAKVFEAGDGLQARKLMEGGNNDVDLIVLDMIMPDMDGNEFYQWLKTSNHDPMVLFATGNGLQPAIENNLLSKSCFYIAKPFRLADFNTKLAEIFMES